MAVRERSSKVEQRVKCGHCGYNVKVKDDGTCPHCGASVTTVTTIETLPQTVSVFCHEVPYLGIGR